MRYNKEKKGGGSFEETYFIYCMGLFVCVMRGNGNIGKSGRGAERGNGGPGSSVFCAGRIFALGCHRHRRPENRPDRPLDQHCQPGADLGRAFELCGGWDARQRAYDSGV